MCLDVTTSTIRSSHYLNIMNYRCHFDIHIVIVIVFVFDSLMNTHTPDHFNYNQTYICIWSCGLMPDSSSKRHGTRCCCF